MTHEPTTRRGFYSIVINGLGALMAAVVAVPAAFYLLIKPKGAGEGEMLEIADLSRISEKRPEEIVYTRTRIDGWRQVKEKTTAWVVKTSGGEAIAFSPQ